jgi:type IV secretory pathway TraG/TraD family ATPase VirD4
MWIGIQDFGKIDVLYGKSIRETIWNNTMTKVILRVDTPESANYLANALGEAEIEMSGTSYSLGVEDYRDGLSVTKRSEIKKLILPSEIQNLQDLSCYIKIGGFNPAKDEVEIVKLKKVAEEYIPRPFDMNREEDKHKNEETDNKNSNKKIKMIKEIEEEKREGVKEVEKKEEVKEERKEVTEEEKKVKIKQEERREIEEKQVQETVIAEEVEEKEKKEKKEKDFDMF